MTKLSILCFYHRIFPSVKFNRVVICVSALVIAWCLALVLCVIFTCKPVQYLWDKSIPGGSCININYQAYGITAASFLTDLVILLLPLRPLFGLQMQLSRKMSIAGIFLLGGLYVTSNLMSTCLTSYSVCLSAIIRLPLLFKLDEADPTCTHSHSYSYYF